MEPKDQDKADKQQDDRPSIRFSDGGIENVDWIKYAGDHGKSTNDLLDRAAKHLESIPRREGETYTEALARWRAEEAQRQSEDPPDEADDRDTPDP